MSCLQENSCYEACQCREEEAGLKETVRSFQVPLTSKLITSATLLGVVVWFVGFIVVCANFLQ
jgi:hypothetical protein